MVSAKGERSVKGRRRAQPRAGRTDVVLMGTPNADVGGVPGIRTEPPGSRQSLITHILGKQIRRGRFSVNSIDLPTDHLRSAAPERDCSRVNPIDSNPNINSLSLLFQESPIYES